LSAPASPARYETLAVLGQGGLATVSLGRIRGAAGFSRLVALKRAHVASPDAVANLRREAELVSRLDHANVVRVLDVVEDGADLVLVLDYVEGGSLADLVRRAAEVELDTRTRARMFVRIVLDVARGLDAAHRATDESGRMLGLVHRDVSPSNVLVGTDGVARLTDFGIAKALEAAQDRTDTGNLKGKIAYMAPEYVESQRADAAGDQFALGVVAWEALAGTRLFRGPTEIETMKRVVAARVPSLASVHPELAPLGPAIERALARAPSDRHASVRDLADALEASAREADLVATHDDVGKLVRELLDAELERRRAAVRAPEGASPPSSSPPGRDLVATGSIVAPRIDRAPADVPRDAPADDRRRRLLVVAVVVAVATVLAFVAASPRGRSSATSPLASSSSSVTSAASPGAVAPEPDPPSAEADISTEGTDAPPATSSSASTTRRRVRGAPRRSPPPPPSLVPRKAPPNPYVR